jgi:hypothetical protein
MPRGSFGYWLLIVFVGTIISTAILVMIGLVIFESYRAFKFATLYDDIRCVPCGVVNVEAPEDGTGGWGLARMITHTPTKRRSLAQRRCSSPPSAPPSLVFLLMNM